MKNLLLFLFLSVNLIAQTNLKKTTSKEIKGYVYHNTKPLKNVSVFIEGKTQGTSTNPNGFFSIRVKTGDILNFKYLGFKTVKIFIEDKTNNLTINMVTKKSELTELNITSKLKKKSARPNIVLGQANINVNSAGVRYLSGEKLLKGMPNLFQALRGKFPGMRIIGKQNEEQAFLRGYATNTPPLWDIDGMVTKSPPNLDPFLIEHVAVINSLIGTTYYGADAAGGVIIISTKNDFRNRKIIKEKEDYLLNNEFYKNDAIAYKHIQIGQPDYVKGFETINSLEVAYSYFKEQEEKYNKMNNFYVNILNKIHKQYNNADLNKKVLSDYEKNTSNIQDLKTIAYRYQELGEEVLALKVFKKIGKIRPNDAQTYRDIANSLLDLKDFKNAWKIYKFYFNEGHKIENNDIGEVLNSELISNYINLKNKYNFKEELVINDPNKVIQSDLRLVFEWNNSDAEFELEFVNNRNQIHKFKNTLAQNNELILDQKIKGYSSKEFVIEDLSNDKWLVNITYLGNKEYSPTQLKVTEYKNWGRFNQTKKVKIFELNLKNVKTQLLHLKSNFTQNYAVN